VPACRTHFWQTVLAGQWQKLGDATLQDALEAAFSAASDGYQFNARGYSYEIDFERMVQTNLSTKRERNLRRVPDPLAASLSTATVTPTTATVAPKTATVAPKIAAVVPTTARSTRATGVPATAPRVKSASTKKAVPVGKTATTLSSPPTAAAAPPVAPTPTAPPLPQGRVKSFLKEKGYGFIVLDGQEVFFHVSVLLDDSVQANDIVEVALAKDRPGSGRVRAKQVRVLRRGSIYRQLCRNKCCQAKGERHFEDRCPVRAKGDAKGDDASVSTACS